MTIANLKEWVSDIANLTRPSAIKWIDGSQNQLEAITALLVRNGTLTPLHPELRPDSFIARTDPRDVARVEDRTFICSEFEGDAGPTNNWMEPSVMRTLMREKFHGSMRGRTMYVIPFSMGPIGSDMARYGVEITDSPYVVASMNIMTRVSSSVLAEIERGADWVPAVHSVGSPLVKQDGTKVQDVPWPCNPDDVYVLQFPETREIWSYGSGYGGNSLLGKKAMSLRIGSTLGRKEGWLAEHMLLIRVTSPNNKRYHIAAAFPSACGKTNLAMLRPTLPGWKVETLGDDIVWMKPGLNGKLRAMNPENGIFGVAPGTSRESNQVAIDSMGSNVIFTNVATTGNEDVWWEGMTERIPDSLTDWQGNPYTGQGKASHPNSRFCIPMTNVSSLAEDWDSPEGVELDAIVFGGRRATNVPLIVHAQSWEHGVFMGATISSEQTAAAEGPVGVLRRDPFAMLPFCGYNMGDYFNHWLSFIDRCGRENLPQVFQVNWFRKNAEGEFLWPGFGENIRAIDWLINRLEGAAEGALTPIGTIPAQGELNLEGLDLDPEQFEELMRVDPSAWKSEASSARAFLEQFGEKLPKPLISELDALESRLLETERVI
jgi:phosphoenolpyruvate carboxykinase (GTP)